MKPPSGNFRTGVSLHSHTRHSFEPLPLLHRYRDHYRVVPALLRVAERQHRRATGEPLKLERAFWTPPLEPHQAMAVEVAQIIGLEMPALVSLTDHDSIEAGLSMASCMDLDRTPISTEWTVPFGETFFHFGVHNLPDRRAAAMASQLAAYTRQPDPATLGELLEWLTRDPGILVVLNHPMWDEGGIGADAHTARLCALLSEHSRRVHALELNGLRSWAENSFVLGLAAAFSLPVVSGGDRYGVEPNACINLTRAESFTEFVTEIRGGGLSEVAFLPHYRDPLHLRWLETARDILRFYPEAPPERQRWTGRFFYQGEDGVRRPFSNVWGSARTTQLDTVLSFVRLMGRPALRPALRLAFAD
jgi:hypothetical protein